MRKARSKKNWRRKEPNRGNGPGASAASPQNAVNGRNELRLSCCLRPGSGTPGSLRTGRPSSGDFGRAGFGSRGSWDVSAASVFPRGQLLPSSARTRTKCVFRTASRSAAGASLACRLLAPTHAARFLRRLIARSDPRLTLSSITARMISAFEHEDLRLALGGRSAASFSDAVPILKYGMVICFVSGSSQAVASPQNVRASSKHGTLFGPSWLSHWCGTCKRTHGCPTGQRFLLRERLCPHPTCP